MTARSPISITLESLADQIKSLQAEMERWRERADQYAKEKEEWKDRAFKQSRETIQKCTELADAKKEQERIFAQGQADHRALHDALGWAHTWHGKDLPTPWRAVTVIIQERDTLANEVRDLRTKLKETTDFMEAYRIAGRLEHERAEAGERMVAAMRRDEDREETRNGS